MGRRVKDRTGNVYGKLTAIAVDHVDERGSVIWLCRCECGKARVFHGRDLERGYARSCGCVKKEAFAQMANGKGLDEQCWRGATRTNKDGYRLVYLPTHPHNKGQYVFEHRVVLERHLNINALPQGSVIHHKNEIPNDNRIENLEYFSCNGDHVKEHARLRASKKKKFAKIRLSSFDITGELCR